MPDKLAEAYRPYFILACLGHIAVSKPLPDDEGVSKKVAAMAGKHLILIRMVSMLAGVFL